MVFVLCGTAASTYTELTKHVAFFDENDDGFIGNVEMFNRLQKLGFSRVDSLKNAAIIAIGLGSTTNSKWLTSFSIDISNIAKGKHSSATQIFSAPNGALDSVLKDSIFLKYDTNSDNTLSQSELYTMVDDNAKSSSGRTLSRGEFNLLFDAAGEDRQLPDGSTERFLSKSTWDKFYTGTLFYDMTGIATNWPSAWIITSE